MARPRVITCNVTSVDGRLTIAPGVMLLFGDDRWTAVAGDADPYTWVRDLHEPDAMLEGSGSFVAPDAPTISHPPHTDALTGSGHHLPRHLVDVVDRRWMAVVDGRGRVRLQFSEWPDPEWAGWHALIVTSRAVAPEHLAWLRDAHIPYIVAGDGPVDLHEALCTMRRELGVGTVVCTGGGRLTGALLRAGLVDEIDIEMMPVAIGGRGTPALFDAPPLRATDRPTPVRLLSCDTIDHGHVRLRYEVEHAG